MENYPRLGCGEHLLFSDSMQFLAGYLKTLASNRLWCGLDMIKQLGAAV